MANDNNNNNNHDAPIPPRVIQTELPASLQEVLRLDPPQQLLCVEAEGHEFPKIQLQGQPQQQQLHLLGLPLLCLACQSSLFLLQLAFDPQHHNNNDNDDTAIIPGDVIWIHEPLESHLLQQHEAAVSARIVRVRPAPQRGTGHALYTPTGCLAVLLQHNSGEYSVVCLERNPRRSATAATSSRHNLNQHWIVKDPVFTFGTEATVQEEDAVVDFCFAQSHSNLSLLASMSILLVRANGHVLAASPFLFYGSLVPRQALENALDYLRTSLTKLDRSQPQWRQVRSAQQFLHDVFPLAEQRQTRFVTAQWNLHQDSAARFPVQLQGPILYQSDTTTSANNWACTIEPFGGGSQEDAELVGFAVGGIGGRVDVGVTAPTTILPRFAMEGFQDSLALEQDVSKRSAWVDRVSLGLGSDNSSESGSTTAMALYPDPNFDSVLHVVSPSHVCTISSNAVHLANVQVLRGSNSSSSEQQQRQTLVWNSLEQLPQPHANSNKVQGVMASPDTVTGHKLLVQFSNGALHMVNVAEEKTRQDVLAHSSLPAVRELLEPDTTTNTNSARLARHQIHQSLASMPPFLEQIQPLMVKVEQGLASMGNVVGSETQYQDVTPEMLAVVEDIKTKCETDVIVPVLELKKRTKVRKEALRELAQQQAAQLAVLAQRRQEMEDQNTRIADMLRRAERNKQILLNRAQAAEQMSQMLAASTTPAEREYFSFVQRTLTQVTKWAGQVEALQEQVQQTIAQREGQTVTVPVEFQQPDVLADLNKISASTTQHLSGARQLLKEADQRLSATLRKAGLEPPSENEPSTSNVVHS